MCAAVVSGCATTSPPTPLAAVQQMLFAAPASVQQEPVASDLDSFIYARSADKTLTANAQMVAAETVARVRPALEDFYASLNNEQKAKFNRLGRDSARRG